MNKAGNNLLSLALVALVSGGVSYATFSYLNKSNEASTSNLERVMQEDSSSLVHRIVARGQGQSPYEVDFTKIAENTVHAVVHIRSTVVRQGRTYVNPFEYYFGGGGGYYREPDQKQEGIGSGVIITKDGYIVTNNHVVQGAAEISVTLNDKREFKATLVGSDPATDIALLKIEGKELPLLPFGNSDDLKVGEWVMAVGNPFNLTSTVTAGIVSAKARNLGTAMSGSGGGVRIESFIQTDAAVNPGNSGGALVNTRGELIGINTAITSETGNFAGISFAVPTSIVSKVIDDLRQYGKVQRAVLGVQFQELTPQLQKEKNLSTLDGIYVATVENRSAALEAGIKDGDILNSINGVDTKTSSEFIEQLSRHRPGDEVKIGVLRDGKQQTLTVKLRNLQGGLDVIKGTTTATDILGIECESLSEKQMQQLGVNYGVQITQLNDGKFKDAGVMKGYVILKINNRPIRNPKDIDDAATAIMQNGSEYGDRTMVVVGLRPNGKTAPFAIDLSE